MDPYNLNCSLAQVFVAKANRFAKKRNQKIGRAVMKIKLFFMFSFLMIQSLMAASIPTIGPKEAFEMVKQNRAVFVDVRETEELKSGMVKGAIMLPLSLMNTDAFEEMIQSLPTDKTLILYCKSGRRAGIMGPELDKRGYPVLNMGGFEAARNAGLPVSY
jgi:phage shock protein E